jgi:site-specific recombinase XerD
MGFYSISLPLQLNNTNRWWKSEFKLLQASSRAVGSGEAVQLRRQDVDIKRRAVVIRQLKKRGEFQRVVPVPSNLYWEILTYYLERTAEDRVFNLTVRQARNVVYSFTEKYLKKRIRPHAIRHSYAVAVLKATKNLEAVRRLLGHRDYTTIKVYLDLTQEDLEQELSKLFS